MKKSCILMPMLAVLCLFGFSSPLQSAEPNQADLDFFEKKIRPVLVKQCYSCHSSASKKIRGRLLLDTRDGIRKGGETGPAVVVGKPEKSLLINAMKHQDFEMPPDQNLSKQVIADFEIWIKRGAADPRLGKTKVAVPSSIDIKKGREFWAFRPLVSQELPQVPGGITVSPIDRFLQSRLAAKSIKPASVADKRTLIRRLSYDLTGLPPTPEQIRNFESDSSSNAYEKLIDRLLASRHFGERWGRHWLDVVRFAESSGGGRTQIYHLAWRYRDYVISAFNEDKPFNKFVAEQISGDLMKWSSLKERQEQLVATGFLLLGPTNYELQDKERLRMEVIDEQLDTMGRAFLGLTIGCARCHDHKFDPIPVDDYYALAGILRSTHVLTPGNVSGYVKRSLPMNDKHARQLAEYEKKINPVKDEIAELYESLRRLKQQMTGLNLAKPDLSSLPGLVIDDTGATLKGSWNSSVSVRGFIGSGYSYASGSDVSARYTFKTRTSGKYEVRVSHTANPNRAANTLVTVLSKNRTAMSRVNQQKRPPINGLWVSVGTFSFQKNESVVVEISGKGTQGVVIADAVQLLPLNPSTKKPSAKTKPKKKPDEKAKNSLTKQIETQTARLKLLTSQMKALGKNAPPAAPLAMAVEDHKTTSDYNICVRGNVHNLGKRVARGFLQVLSGDKPVQIAKSESGRLQLGKWLGGNTNPLTPRVYANRIWHHLFGAGIVRTVDNFGVSGERPSHPELLDWLAAQLMKDGWSTKSLIRHIVLSHAYRQSTRHNPVAAQADPENRLLWRQNRRRLDAEAIRDTILAVSGQLDLTPSGPSLSPKQKSEFGFKHTSMRRSVYVPVLRNTLHEIFEVFDFSDPNLVVGRRNVSTLPTQSLYLMNSPFVMQQAKFAAIRLLKEHKMKRDAQIELAYRRTLGRSPSPAEKRLTSDYLARQIQPVNTPPGKQPATETARIQAWSGVFQALYSCLDFRYID